MIVARTTRSERSTPKVSVAGTSAIPMTMMSKFRIAEEGDAMDDHAGGNFDDKHREEDVVDFQPPIHNTHCLAGLQAENYALTTMAIRSRFAWIVHDGSEPGEHSFL